MNHMKVRALCEGAVLLAVAQILSYIKLWEMPWGGSIVLSMVPLVLYAVRWGLGAGLLDGFLFGVLQFMFDGGFAIGWESIIGDYLLAFTVLGLPVCSPVAAAACSWALWWPAAPASWSTTSWAPPSGPPTCPTPSSA